MKFIHFYKEWHYSVLRLKPTCDKNKTLCKLLSSQILKKYSKVIGVY